MAIKILSAAQIRRVDAATIQNESISSIDLMERAAQECADAFIPHLSLAKPVHIFCGSGNNGGDGFAVARILAELGFPVETYFVEFGPVTPDCEQNRRHLRTVKVTEILYDVDLPALGKDDIVIDALLGAGTSRQPAGILARTIHHINKAGGTVLAIDLPSGLPADELPEWDAVIRASFTATFEQPKLTFFFAETAAFVGNWAVLHIGLNRQAIAEEASRHYYLDAASMENSVIPRERFSHKGTYGHALLIAGSKGKMGAAVLSARATLRSGVGLLTVHVPATGLDVMQGTVPEAMCSADKAEDHISVIEAALDFYAALGIGPGIGTFSASLEVLKQILSSGKTIVIDADGLNILSMYPELLEQLPVNTVLTPHPKEFERLAGPSESSADRLDRLIHFSQTYGCIVILKDAITAIAIPSGKVYFNTTGNPGMATAGAGDVLTGIVLGLLAQGYLPETAAQLAVYFHGKAGDEAAAARSQAGLIASDIIEHLKIDR